MILKNKKLIIIIFIALFAIGFVAFLNPVLAADDYGATAAKGSLKGTAADIASYIGNVAGAAIALAGSIFLFLVIYGGIIIMTAAGNPEKIGKGKNIIIWAIIGALVLGGAYAITTLVFTAISGGGATPTVPANPGPNPPST